MLPSIVPLLSARSPTRYLETHGCRVGYLGMSNHLPPMRVTMTRLVADVLCVVGLIGKGEVKDRGGRVCRSLPIGIYVGERA